MSHSPGWRGDQFSIGPLLGMRILLIRAANLGPPIQGMALTPIPPSYIEWRTARRRAEFIRAWPGVPGIPGLPITS